MCLYIRDKQPRVAQRDIVVLKYLKQVFVGGSTRYESPCQRIPVTLGGLTVAHPETPNIEYEDKDVHDREIYGIREGVIHAKLDESEVYGNYCAKAIIPKGTEYWINSFGTEIAARQMFVTKEKGTNKSVDIQLFREILKSAPEKNGIRVGDYQMIDNSFVHPTKKIAKTKVRGIVCGFYKDESPIICALEVFKEVWDNHSPSKIGEDTSWKKATEVLNGREVTARYKEQIKGRDKQRFNAFERCINYRKDKGEDWYFGSLGETLAMLDNAAYLNAAHMITGLGFFIDSDYWYWSCSERFISDTPYTSWCSHLNRGEVRWEMASKGFLMRVVPFYDYTNKSKNKNKKRLQ